MIEALQNLGNERDTTIFDVPATSALREYMTGLNNYEAARNEAEAIVRSKEAELAVIVQAKGAEIAEARALLKRLDAIIAMIGRKSPGHNQQPEPGRANRGEASEKVRQAIEAAGAGGITRAQLIAALGPKVDNPVQTLRKNGIVELADGRYRLASPQPPLTVAA